MWNSLYIDRPQAQNADRKIRRNASIWRYHKHINNYRDRYFERKQWRSLLCFSISSFFPNRVVIRRFGIAPIFSIVFHLLFACKWRDNALSFEILRLTVARVKMPVLETLPFDARGDEGRKHRLGPSTDRLVSQGLHSNWISMKDPAQKLALTIATQLIHKSDSVLRDYMTTSAPITVGSFAAGGPCPLPTCKNFIRTRRS